MLAERVLVTIILLPLGLAAIQIGGPVYAVVVTIILGLGAYEWVQLFRAGGYRPAGVLVIGGAVFLALGRAWNGFESAPVILSLLVLASMAVHLIEYERGRDMAATDFALTLAGFLYIGWIGAYLISLRSLPEGNWWTLTVLPSVWLADSGAYFIGRRFGRHKLSPRLSPKKTWEGYWGGVVAGTLGGFLLPYLWALFNAPISVITPLRGAVIGFTLSILTTLGDLGESMIKRQLGVKDSGKLLPGHGGVFDRIDSWLWGAVIGYYLVVWLVS